MDTGRRVQNEQYVIQVSGIPATQSDFSRLRGSRWLNDNIIDMFLRRYVQEMTPGAHCYTTHFMERLLKVQGTEKSFMIMAGAELLL